MMIQGGSPVHNGRAAVVVLALLFTGAVSACTRLIPASVADFGADKTVVVTLRDGETIKGHIRKGDPVTFTTFGRVYRAKVEDMDDAGNIVLSGAYVQEEYEQYSLQRERMEGAQLHITDNTKRISIPAYKIVKVEEVTIDKMKSARASAFWSFTFFVVAKILGARL
jgi:small nuclear ribonucleoprotein (snRNP)-like protein